MQSTSRYHIHELQYNTKLVLGDETRSPFLEKTNSGVLGTHR